MTANDKVRQELSFGIGERQDVKEMGFTITHKIPDFDPSSILYFDSIEKYEAWANRNK